jgi:hypothetical protein
MTPRSIRKPPFWDTLSFCGKAGYLCASMQCRTFSEACSVLASLPRRKRPARPAVPEYAERLEQQKLF